MAIRCSVLGHAWGDPEVEREREERGSEVVVTVREFRACRRCGGHDVLGEATEVTAAATAGRAEDASSGDASPAGGATPPGEAPPGHESGGDVPADDSVTAGDDAEIIDDTTESDAARTGGGASDGEASDPVGNGEYPDDDGVILDADDELADGPGEWSAAWPDPGRPDEDDDEYDPRPWPDAEPPDPAERGPDDADVVEAAGPARTRGDREGEPVDPAEVLSEAASDQGIAPDDPGPDEELPLEDVEVYCPNCRFVDERPTPSLRGGDSCPECRSHYLRERDR